MALLGGFIQLLVARVVSLSGEPRVALAPGGEKCCDPKPKLLPFRMRLWGQLLATTGAGLKTILNFLWLLILTRILQKPQNVKLPVPPN